MEEIRYCASCLFGAEGILRDELRRMDAREVSAQTGRVYFSGGPEMMARANLRCRTAERVQVLMGAFRARSFEELFQGVKALPWERLDRPEKGPVSGKRMVAGFRSCTAYLTASPL